MNAVDIAIGDIFHWRYASVELHSDHLSYWAKSRIAVAVVGDILRDTYWSGNDGTWWTYGDAVSTLTLTRIANFAELEKISEMESMYYAEADIVNLNHPNCSAGNCYRRKGAGRSRAVMLDKLEYEVEKAKADIRRAERDIERLTEARRVIQCAADLKGISI